MAKFFRYPFATAGDRTVIPDPTQVDGSMSYEEGYPIDYQKNLTSDPDAKAINRAQFNELMYETTLAIQQYQTEGFPDFITSAENGGSPYPYDIYAIVRFDPGTGVQIYQSLVNGNTDTPPSSQWRTVALLSGSFAQLSFNPTYTQTIPPGDVATKILFNKTVTDSGGIIVSNGFVPPAGQGEFSVTLVVSGTYVLPTRQRVFLYKNGSHLFTFNTAFVVGANPTTLVGVFSDKANGTDQYDVYVANADVALDTTVGDPGVIPTESDKFINFEYNYTGST